MGALIHAKTVKGKKIWYVWGTKGNDKWERQYPECRSRSEFYEILRNELGLSNLTSKTDVVVSLFTKTWTGQRWEDDFGIYLRELREKAGLTQTALAEKSDLSVQAISALESSTRAPSWDTVRRLAFALDVEETAFKDKISSESLRKALGDLEKET